MLNLSKSLFETSQESRNYNPFNEAPSRANFLTAVTFSKRVATNPSREQKKAAVFAILDLVEEKSRSLH